MFLDAIAPKAPRALLRTSELVAFKITGLISVF